MMLMFLTALSYAAPGLVLGLAAWSRTLALADEMRKLERQICNLEKRLGAAGLPALEEGPKLMCFPEVAPRPDPLDFPRARVVRR